MNCYWFPGIRNKTESRMKGNEPPEKIQTIEDNNNSHGSSLCSSEYVHWLLFWLRAIPCRLYRLGWGDAYGLNRRTHLLEVNGAAKR